VVENYPDLKASRNFLSLQDQIEGTENRVAIERRNYNEFSRRYNTRLQVFPSNVVGQMMGFESKPYFEAETAALKGLGNLFDRDKG
jgi:LemA protein